MQQAGFVQRLENSKRPHTKNLAGALSLFLLCFGAYAYSYFVWGPVTVADLIWGLAAVLVLLRRPSMSRMVLRLFGWFVLFAVCTTLLRIIIAPGSIDASEAARSVIKLLFYLTSTAVLTIYLTKWGYTKVSKCISWIAIILALIVLLQYFITFVTGTCPSFLLWSGYFSGDFTHWYRFGNFRAAGIFGEPSWMAISLVLTIAYLMVVQPREWPLLSIVISIVAIVLSFALSGYLLLLTILALQLPRLIRQGTSRVVLSLTVFVLIVSLPLMTLLPQTVFSRVDQALTFQDSSTRDRLLGSWELSFKALDQAYLYGVGLGNLERFYEDVSAKLKFKKNPVGKMGSILTYVLATGGILGLLIFLLAVFATLSAARRCYSLLVYFAAFWATAFLLWGMFLTVPFWFFLALGISALPQLKSKPPAFPATPPADVYKSKPKKMVFLTG